MSLPADMVAKLNMPLAPARVHKREGSGGQSLDYLATHDVIRIANAIFGYGQWGHEIVDLTQIGCDPVTSKNGKPGYKVGYRCTVRLTVTGCVPTSGVGYGDAQDYSGGMITPHELAAKEAESDALKRALKNYGDQFGLVLYAKPGDERQRVEREAAIRRQRAITSSEASTTGGGRPSGGSIPQAPPHTSGAQEAPPDSGEHGTESVEAATVSVPQPDSPAASTPATGPEGDGASSGPSPFAPPASVPVQKPASAAQKKALNALIGRVREQARRVTTAELWAFVGRTPDTPEDGEHFAPLRESLTLHEASELIEHLKTLEGFAVADGALEPRRAA